MSKVIKLIDGAPQVIEDDWELIRNESEINPASFICSIVPFTYFQRTLELPIASRMRGVWISPDDDFEPFASSLSALDLIAVEFPSFRDGRGYSVATLLRTRYGWTGELRAIGDVLRDQLNFMRRCGFNAFAVRADKDIHDAIKSFSHYSVKYQGAVDDPLPLFRRRSEVDAW